MSSEDLFQYASAQARQNRAPLAERMRPQVLTDYAGQEEILAPGKVLRKLIEDARQTKDKTFPSLIFWGPPGCGKTTLSLLISKYIDAHFVQFSAVSSGIRESRECIEEAGKRLQYSGQKTVLFIDEIHRFNKSQQDAFLPAVENGTLSLIGATTENPSFEINSALLSRMKVFVLKPLDDAAVVGLLKRACEIEKFDFEIAALEAVAQFASGDARSAYNSLEMIASTFSKVTLDTVQNSLQRNTLLYDKGGEEHYNLISALHKSIRHSDPQASVYYVMRMLEGGEDPLFVARRLVRAASEDIGLADPQALLQALAAKEAAHFVGVPECNVILAQAAIYLACAPKSNEVYKAVKKAQDEIQRSGPLAVPLAYRNAPTKLMKEIGYGKGYQYDHDVEGGVSQNEALPESIRGKIFYTPKDLAFEKEIKKRIAYFADKSLKR